MLQNPTSSLYAATREREIEEGKGEKGRKEEKRTEEERRRRKKRRRRRKKEEKNLFKWVKKLNRDMEKQKQGKMENKGKQNKYKDSIIRKSGTI